MSRQMFRSKPKFIVMSRQAAISAVGLTHKSRFVRSKNGGLMAENRVNGRIVFPDKRGPQPLNDGKSWEFRIIGENPAKTVFFGQVITSDSPEAQPMKIIIHSKGKIVCLNRRPTKFFASEPTKKRFLAEYRQGFAKWQGFEVGPEGSLGTSYFSCDCGRNNVCDCSQYVCNDDGDDDNESIFDKEISTIFDSLPTKPVNCHSCGFEDCRCDGTASDWVPARTTLNVLA